MRSLFIFLTITFRVITSAQAIPPQDSLPQRATPVGANQLPMDKFKTDTLRLGDLSAKKIIAYRYHSVTFYVDARDYRKSIKIFWERYKDGMKFVKAGDPIGDYERRWLLIDSVYQAVRKFSRRQDTMFLNQRTFDKVGLRELMDFDVSIENGRCAIYDQDNIRQTIIIRRKGSWFRGPLAAWGGRRYYLPGEPDFFYAATDWIS